MRNIIFLVILFFTQIGFSQSPCVIDGDYQLKLHPWNGQTSPFWLEGVMDGENVRLRVSGFMQYGTLFVDGSFRGLPVKLSIEVSSVYNNQWMSGTIGKTKVFWPGDYGLFVGQTGCLQ